MNAPAKLGAYAVVLALSFAGGAALGTAVGPIGDGGDDGNGDMNMEMDVEHGMRPNPDGRLAAIASIGDRR